MIHIQHSYTDGRLTYPAEWDWEGEELRDTEGDITFKLQLEVIVGKQSELEYTIKKNLAEEVTFWDATCGPFDLDVDGYRVMDTTPEGSLIIIADVYLTGSCGFEWNYYKDLRHPDEKPDTEDDAIEQEMADCEIDDPQMFIKPGCIAVKVLKAVYDKRSYSTTSY